MYERHDIVELIEAITYAKDHFKAEANAENGFCSFSREALVDALGKESRIDRAMFGGVIVVTATTCNTRISIDVRGMQDKVSEQRVEIQLAIQRDRVGYWKEHFEAKAAAKTGSN